MLKNKAKFALRELAGPTAGLSLYHHIIRAGIVGKIPFVQSEE